jgi:hypothetical protein
MYGKALVCCLALWSAGALAQDQSGAYLGGGLGQFDFVEEGAGSLAIDDTALSYRVYGGYRFNDTFAVEGSYGKTDEMSESDQFIVGPNTVNATVRAEYDFLEARGLAHLKAFFAGIGYWEADLSASVDINSVLTGPISVPASDTDSGVSVVLGGQWDLDRVGVRVELAAYDMDNVESAYNFGLGVYYRF